MLAARLRSIHTRIRPGQFAHLAASTKQQVAFSTNIFTSPHGQVQIPDHSIWGLVHERAKASGDKEAFIDGITNESYTFQELQDRSRNLAAALASDGVRKGDVVLLHSINCIEYPIVVTALAGLGAVCSLASPMATPTELSNQLKAAKARYLISHHELSDIAIQAAASAGLAQNHIYTMGKRTKRTDLVNINDMAMRDGHNYEFEFIDPKLHSILPFSSGTTGNPKGVSLSARNVVANAMQVNAVEKIEGHSLGLLPFFHIYGFLLLHLSVSQGVPKVVLPRFMPDTLLQALTTYNIRTAHIAPPTLLFLAHHPAVDDYDLSNTKYLVSGGAPVGKGVEKLVHDRVGIKVKQVYGCTELSPAVNWGEDDNLKPGSVGRLVPNTELRVKCTKTDKDLGVNERGELLYRGPQVMMGYLDNPEATAATVMEDGFLRTGDIGYIDEDGFVFVVDRVKELIKYKGHQVAPGELEDILKGHPDVADSCCVRSKDEMGEEIPKAFIVLKDPKDESEEMTQGIMDYVADRVSPYKKIRAVQFTHEIPKNPSGKILRRHVQERENSQEQ